MGEEPECAVESWGAITAFGEEGETAAALTRGEVALKKHPVLGARGGDAVPLACLCPGWDLPDAPEPAWLGSLENFVARVPEHPWGTARFPVIVTGSNFGIDSLLAFRLSGVESRLAYILPERIADWLRQKFGWGSNLMILSHACVSASLGLAQGARLLARGGAERVLVLSFDFLSPFVTGGFHALKILNAEFPAPFALREFGAIGLGDGAGYAVLAKGGGPFRLAAHAVFNEMFHFTGNDPSGGGFRAVATGIAPASGRLWVKGHGTGTLEAGKLEADMADTMFPDAPLVSWKGSIGHTLGSCGAVELALAIEMIRSGRIAGTPGCGDSPLPGNVAREAFAADEFDGAILQSNAFGGAHAATLLTWS